jgi:hypothetical protein
MLQKSNETDFLFTKVVIYFNHQCYPLQNSSLGQLHSNEGVVPTFGSSAGNLQPVWSSACPIYSPGCFLNSSKDVFKFRKKEKVTDERGLWNHRNSFWGQKVCYREGSVTWGIVMMEHPFVCNVSSHGNYPFSEPFKDIFIKKLGNMCNVHAEDHTGWRLPVLLSKVGTMSLSVHSCPRELFWRG